MDVGGASGRRFWEATAEVESLVWDGDELLDVVGGGRRWGADGVERPSSFIHDYPFDRGIVSPSGRFTVVYAERGTEALLLEGDQLVRELERDDEIAEDFDYPVALGALRDGREVLVHCPRERGTLEIDDLETGKRLTHGVRRPRDVFHSRLAVSPGGRYLMSAGWLWHPYGIVEVFDLDDALADSAVLDGQGVLPADGGIDDEVRAACWLDGDRLAVSTEGRTRQLGVWSLSAGRWLCRNSVDFSLGTLVARGETVVSLHGHPRLVEVATGAVVAEWPAVEVSLREDSFGATHIPTPVVALHPDGSRLAVAQPDGIAVIDLPGR
ncbi:WD40 repeat domain-containing protein [Streptomyces sp. NPDC006733]|uniref:WD40 repeat domain-containing protein n=1 Tax=Streptomyces sp. NPDC006733 TaxID=3155460 RepID=UPI0033F76DDA